MEPGLEHPGKQNTRTGTSGGRRPRTGASGEAAAWDWNVRGCERRGDTVAENNGEKHMNKGKDQMRKDTTKESQEA